MKNILFRLSVGCLLTLAATVNLPALCQQPASPAAPVSQGGDPFANDPALRGVTLTSEQKAKLLNIAKESSSRVKQMLTPAQKKLVMTKGPSALPLNKLSEPQRRKYIAIVKDDFAKKKAVFTPDQLKQIEANIQSLQKSPAASPSSSPK